MSWSLVRQIRHLEMHPSKNSGVLESGAILTSSAVGGILRETRLYRVIRGQLPNSRQPYLGITSGLSVSRPESMPTGDHLLRAGSPLQIGCDFSISFT